MADGKPGEVLAAFEMLLEEIEAEIGLTNKAGVKAFEAKDYDRVKANAERAEAQTALRDRVAALRDKWQSDFGRAKQPHLPRGVRTPEDAYRLPVLQALEALGGSAPMAQALDQVHASMAGTLREVDLQPLPSDPDVPRWRNAAQWARHSMVKEGLLKPDSPRGVWEITPAGRAALTQLSQSANTQGVLPGTGTTIPRPRESIHLHVEIFLASRMLGARAGAFTKKELLRRIHSEFRDKRKGLSALISSHCVANARKNAPVVQNYLWRIETGRYRCFDPTKDTPHPSRLDAPDKPQEADVPEQYRHLLRA